MNEITGKLSTALDGRYQIERHLGEGGMASVYLAQDLKHDRQVALKVLFEIRRLGAPPRVNDSPHTVRTRSGVHGNWQIRASSSSAASASAPEYRAPVQ